MKKKLEGLRNDFDKAVSNMAQLKDEALKYQNDSRKLQEEITQLQVVLAKAHEQIQANDEAGNELKVLKAEIQRFQTGEKKSNETQIQIARLQEENDRLSAQVLLIYYLIKYLKNIYL